MRNLAFVLIVLAAMCFIIAAISGVFTVFPFGIAPEGYSSASTNLALLAVALLLYSKKD